jgi:2-oxoglutarate dehydrogenase E2 component (dihydrolipoamide succinyltransferase)
VRRIAKDNHLDLNRIAGTGSNGRITKEDVLRHLSEDGPGSATAASAVGDAETASGELASSRLPASSLPTSSLPISSLPGQFVPLTKMRAIIAQRMVESKAISPHVHMVFKMDMTRIARIREREKAKYERQNGVKLTYMPFIAVAVVEALRKFPIVNASLEGSSIRYHSNINLGIAVALEWGLIVPVIKEVEERSFLGLTRAIADLAERARGKKLLPSEVSGSTFTLTNSGVFGDEFGTPIINQPESAILAIGGLKKEAVVLTDSDGNDTIAIRSMQHFCLGFDHRTIDGADAGKFMGYLKRTLENWDKEIG